MLKDTIEELAQEKKENEDLKEMVRVMKTKLANVRRALGTDDGI